jgi:5'-nucleotidase
LNILCTNDDGFDAIGLKTLIQACSTFGNVWVCAPNAPASECSHSVHTARDLCLEDRTFRQVALNGSPADCSRIALREWIKEPIDLVCSGINAGGNLGVDIYYSGTVAAAREAHILGYAAIAFSMVLTDGIEHQWHMAQQGVERGIQQWIDQQKPRELWNINFPSHMSHENLQAHICPLEASPLAVAYDHHHEGYRYCRHNYHKRPRTGGSDVDLCFGGHTTLSKLQLFV